jgi:restriction endonuclease S subunit
MNLNQYSNAAAQPGLSLDNIKFLKLPVPPIEEQQAIAHYLDERCGKLDSIIAIKKQQIQTLDTLRQSIIYQAVTKGLDGSVELVDSGVEWLGEIPKGWRLDRLKDIVSLRDEKSTEKSDAEDYLELEDLEQGTGRLLSIRNTLEVGSAVMKFYKNDVLFGKLRPYLQKYYLAKFDGKCTGEILAFKPERITPEFLLYFIATDGFIKICTAMSYGVKMPRVNYPKQLASLPVCLPKVPEQQAIADYLDQETQRLEQLKANLTQQIGVLLDYKKSLIYECVTGKKHIFKAG